MNALRQTDARTLYYAWLDACKSDKLSMLYTFPVFDGKLLTKATFNMRTIPKMPKILGMTNADMIPVLVSGLIRRWAHDDKGSPCYAYCFDRDLPGDNYGSLAHGRPALCLWHTAKQLATLYRYGQGDLAPNGGGLCQLCQVRQSQLQRPAPLESRPPRSCALATPAVWRPSRTAVSLKKHFITKDRYK